MLATSERVSPCRARCSPRSVGRVTVISSPSCTTVMSRGMRSESSPLGPCTRTTSGSIVTVTPEGTGMGLRPIRDIALLPDLRHDLAADAVLAGSWPVMTPGDVETIEVPMPPWTLRTPLAPA